MISVRNLLKWIGPIGVNREDAAEWLMGLRLWGYPDLVKEFHDRVRPALFEARDERIEREWREQVGDNDLVFPPAIVDQEEGDTPSIPPQDDGAGPFCLMRSWKSHRHRSTTMKDYAQHSARGKHEIDIGDCERVYSTIDHRG